MKTHRSRETNPKNNRSIWTRRRDPEKVPSTWKLFKCHPREGGDPEKWSSRATPDGMMGEPGTHKGIKAFAHSARDATSQSRSFAVARSHALKHHARTSKILNVARGKKVSFSLKFSSVIGDPLMKCRGSIHRTRWDLHCGFDQTRNGKVVFVRGGEWVTRRASIRRKN